MQFKSWFQKVSVLTNDWWKNAQYHLDNAIRNILHPHPPKIGLNYEGKEPVYIPNTENKNIVGLSVFKDNEIVLYVSLWANLKKYNCFMTFGVDTSTKGQLSYNNKAKSRIYHTDTIDGLETMSGNLVGVRCVIKRQSYDRETKPVKVTVKMMGPVDLVEQEATPFNIIDTFRNMILSDFDNDNDNDLSTPDVPTEPAFDTPDVPTEPANVSPSLSLIGQ